MNSWKQLSIKDLHDTGFFKTKQLLWSALWYHSGHRPQQHDYDRATELHLAEQKTNPEHRTNGELI